MSDKRQGSTPFSGPYTVRKQDFGKIRLYNGVRSLVFLVCLAICFAAVLPNGSMSVPTTAAWMGLVLLLGFVLAYKLSKPAIVASFALPKRGRSIAVWNGLGIITAFAYAAGGWGYVEANVAYLIMSVAGTAFFGIVLFSSIRMFFNPGLGGSLVQMVDAHRYEKQNRSNKP